MHTRLLLAILCILLTAPAVGAAGESPGGEAITLPPGAKFYLRPSADTTGSSFKGMGARNTPFAMDKALKKAFSDAGLLAEEKEGNYTVKTSIIQYSSDRFDNTTGIGGNSPQMDTATRIADPEGNDVGRLQTRIKTDGSGSPGSLFDRVAQDIVSQLKTAMGLVK